MAQYKALAPNVEVSGEGVLSFVEALGTFRQMALGILENKGITDPQAGTWYGQQAWLDAFKEIADATGGMTLKTIGKKIPEVALWPPDVDTVEKALASIDVAYHMNHRGGEIGCYAFAEVAERSGKMICDNPYPCDFDWGIIESTARRFASAGMYPMVKHDTTQACRKKGEDSCTYLITW